MQVLKQIIFIKSRLKHKKILCYLGKYKINRKILQRIYNKRAVVSKIAVEYLFDLYCLQKSPNQKQYIVQVLRI